VALVNEALAALRTEFGMVVLEADGVSSAVARRLLLLLLLLPGWFCRGSGVTLTISTSPSEDCCEECIADLAPSWGGLPPLFFRTGVAVEEGEEEEED